MLDWAYLHRGELPDLYARFIGSPRSRWYVIDQYLTFELPIPSTTAAGILQVSVHEGQILGFMGADINRLAGTVDGLRAIRFGDEYHGVFQADLRAFVRSLLVEHRFRKVNWSVVVGNPAERLYDRICGAMGGRVLGTFRQDVRMPDGRICDRKVYEVLADELPARYR